jgi:hypothetical protein
MVLILFVGGLNTYKVFGQEILVGDTISYQNIIPCERLKGELLFKKITSTIYQIYDSAAISLIGNSGAEIQVQMKVYNQFLGKMGHPAGLLSFLYKIEVKDEKFRCLVDNFYFTPMERDRYGRFQVVRTEAELVCENNFNANSSIFKKIKSQSEDYASKLSEKLKVEAISEASTEIEW